MPQDTKHVNTTLFKKKCEMLALVTKMTHTLSVIKAGQAQDTSEAGDPDWAWGNLPPRYSRGTGKDIELVVCWSRIHISGMKGEKTFPRA